MSCFNAEIICLKLKGIAFFLLLRDADFATALWPMVLVLSMMDVSSGGMRAANSMGRLLGMPIASIAGIKLHHHQITTFNHNCGRPVRRSSSGATKDRWFLCC
ncbi:hypothetical protein NC652_038849 [Populus alba x Populus x berolinensis]|nr:hypothetical protein NC652_038849 [Populus alba x Populus x berolinensis]